MKILLFALLFWTLVAAEAGAGTITGTVRAQGKQGMDTDPSSGKYDSRQFKFVERVNYDEMHDFVVYIDGPVGAKVAAPEKPVQVVTQRVSQKGAVFVPHILPVMMGTTVEWPNNDTIYHNVFSMSETKPFDLGLYKSPQVKKVTFDKPGRVDVFCSIHTRMNCVVLVLENPYFSNTNEKGQYAITNVPAGLYKLKAWGERLPSQTSEIRVPENGEVKADFKLGITNLPQP
jgi:plastocyanin